MNYNNMVAATAFTLFVNNGGLRIPSQSVYSIIDYSEKLFKERVANTDTGITNETRLKEKLIMMVFNHFSVESTQKLFTDHNDGLNESMFTGDHRATLIKLIAERYIRLCLYTYGKRFSRRWEVEHQASVDKVNFIQWAINGSFNLLILIVKSYLIILLF